MKNYKHGGLKKHVTQMNELEKDFLERKFREVAPQEWKFTSYSQKRFDNRGIDPKHFMSIFKGFDLIEFNRKNSSNRVLLRSKAIHDNKQVCVSFNLTEKKIITCYLNFVGNKHDNLVISEYNSKVDILKYF